MRVYVTFYGGLKREAGRESEVFELHGQPPTLDDLIDAIIEKYPSVSAHLGSLAYTVGDELVDRPYQLKDGDEVGFLPPVSGG